MVLGNVNLADVESGKILEDRFMILKDRVIMQGFPSSKLPDKGEGLNVTDGKGAYVFPALAAMNGYLTVAMDGKRQL
jgi:adenine deaminase